MRYLALLVLPILSTATVSAASVDVKPPFKVGWSKAIDGGFQSVVRETTRLVSYCRPPSVGKATASAID